MAAWLALFVLFVRRLPSLIDWVSDQADRGWSLRCWSRAAESGLIGDSCRQPEMDRR